MRVVAAPVAGWDHVGENKTFTAGSLTVVDSSQNQADLTVNGIDGGYGEEDFFYSIVSPEFDTNATSNKVRIRSFEDRDTAKENFSYHGTLFELPWEVGIDDRRFSIESSLVHA